MKTLFYTLSLTAFFLTSCSTDNCKDVNCNMGTCNDGNCICETGYTGTNCETEARLAFVGNYSTTDVCNVGTFNYAISIAADAESITELSISNIGDLNINVVALVDEIQLTIEEQTVGGKTISGSGLLQNDTLNVTYTLDNGNGQTLACTLEGLLLE